MDATVMLLDCPAYTDGRAGRRCGLPAEVEYWYAVGSTDGPLESAKIRCPRGHWFNGPIESLTRREQREGPATDDATARRDAVWRPPVNSPLA
jgi:hypothetical protein